MSCIFISYSQQDRSYVKGLVQALESYGLPVWMDDRIDYGETWPAEIAKQLQECQAFLVVVSPRSEASHWVQCELQLALKLKKPIFPVLLEGELWLPLTAVQAPEVKDGKLPPDNFFATIGKHFPQQNPSAEPVNATPYTLPEVQPTSCREDRNERTLVEAVWTEVADRLRQSLHNAILIRLDMAEQRHQVRRPWDSQLRTADQSIKTLAPGTHIAEVFDRRDVGGKLLILGNPGSGKTTTMLDLTAVLIQRANNQPNEPIPVMFNLSSWQNEKQSITDWLLSELKLKYGVSQRLGKTWLKDKLLLPLLDGLDELPSQRQKPVVAGINDWLQSGKGPSRLLVCSRLEEYELYATHLALNGAICLEALTDQQLQKYLDSMGMGVLWESFQQDEALLSLVRTPLLLSLSIIGNKGIVLEHWQQKQTAIARMEYLLDTYVLQCLHGEAHNRESLDRNQPTAQQTRRWLIWLAQQLESRSESEFLIEKMQATTLETRWEKGIYGFIAGSIWGLAYGLGIGSGLGLIILAESSGILTSVFVCVAASLLIGILFGFAWIPGTIYGGDMALRIIPFYVSRHVYIRSFRFYGGVKFFIIVLPISVILGAIFGFLFLGNLLNAIAFSGFICIFSIIIFSDFFEQFSGGEWRNSRPNLPMHECVFSYSFMWIFYVLISLATGVFISGFYPIEAVLYSVSMILGSCGTIGLILLGSAPQHFALRIVLYRANAIPWNYARFLDHCTDRLLLQRVGGRYRFIHKLVQEHFAAMPLSPE